MNHFGYEGGCGILVLGYLKEELAWAIDKQFQFISYLKQLIKFSKN